MKRKISISDKILSLLKKNPMGMDIIEISKEIKHNRLTVSKYLYGLVLSKKVFIRRVGNSKLHYLKKEGKTCIN